MNSNATQHILHILAGLVIVAAPMFFAGIPLSIQSETIGGVIALVLSFVKSYYTTA